MHTVSGYINKPVVHLILFLNMKLSIYIVKFKRNYRIKDLPIIRREILVEILVASPKKSAGVSVRNRL
jgi:hypothetical protein